MNLVRTWYAVYKRHTMIDGAFRPKIILMAKVHLPFLMLFVWNVTIAQTGPGGVGNGLGSVGQPRNIVWLDAEALSLGDGDPVASWEDRSGNGFNATRGIAAQQPSFTTAVLNGRPLIRFDGTDDALNLDTAIATTTDGILNGDYSVIIVGARRTSTSNDGWFLYGTGPFDAMSNLYMGWRGGDPSHFRFSQFGAAELQVNSGNYLNDGVNQYAIFTGTFGQTASPPRKLYENAGLIGTNTSTQVLTSYPGAELGGISGANECAVDIAEAIFYQGELNEAQIIIINNYLSAKYDVSLTAFDTVNRDYYAGDAPANGNYDYDVVGIGQESASQHAEAYSSGITLNAVSGLDTDGEYVMAGHNNTSHGISTMDLSGSVQQRWNRSWYIDKTGTIDTEITFDLNILVPGGNFAGPVSNYVLLRRVGTTYQEVPINNGNKSMTASTISFRVNDTDLTDGVYTIGTLDTSLSPLIPDGDNDNDGIANSVDLDDDNDGIPDTVEYGVCSGNLFTNSDFSAGLTGWNPMGNLEILSNRLDAVTFNTGNSTPNGTVSQTLSTIPNHNYQLEFFVGNGGSLNPGLALQIEIDGIAMGAFMPAQAHQLLFTAATGSTTITFRDISTTTNATDVFLRAPSVCLLDQDTDMDGIPNRVDLDSDNDGIYDAVEAGHGQSQTNGLVNGNVGTDGIPDAVQGAGNANSGTINYTLADSDTDGTFNFLSLDSDGDGCTDVDEAYGLGNDTDADGIFGTGVPAITTDGAVTGAAYGIPLDGSGNGTFDYTEVGLPSAITQQPESQYTFVGGSATFTAQASGNMQWQQSTDGGLTYTDIAGANAATLAVSNVSASQNGTKYQLVVADLGYACTTTLISFPVTLTVDGDVDSDGIPDQTDLDDDNDGIPDTDECGANMATLTLTGDFSGTATSGSPVTASGFNAGAVGNSGDVYSIQLSSTIQLVTGANDVYEDCTIRAQVDRLDDGLRVDINGVTILNFNELHWRNDADFQLAGKFNSNGNTTGAFGWTPWNGEGNAELIITPHDIQLLLDTDSGTRENALVYMRTTIGTGNDDFIYNPVAFDCSAGVDFDIFNANRATATRLEDVTLTVEATVCNDNDADGVLNLLDLDSDNDGIYDAVEAGHGQPHTNGMVNGNVGNDGIPDAVQGTGNADSGTINYTLNDSNTDGTNDVISLDSDGDGCTDVDEAYGLGNDTDTDGIFGTGAPGVDANGAVAAAAYTVPLDGNSSGTPDYREIATPITVTAQPADQVATMGSTATFSISSDADGYQWQLSTDFGITFADIPGETSSSLLVGPITMGMVGQRYRVEMIRNGNVCGNSLFSTTVTLLSDADADGIADLFDLDDDNDGIPDNAEGCIEMEDFNDGALEAFLEETPSNDTPEVVIDYSTGQAVFSHPTNANRTRKYIRSLDGGFYTKNVMFEVTALISNSNAAIGTPFVGLGPGTASTTYFGEPEHPILGANVRVDLNNLYFHDKMPGDAYPTSNRDALSDVSGTQIRFRISWDALTKIALIEVDTDYNGTFVTDYSRRFNGGDNGFTNSNMHVYFGGGRNVTFEDFILYEACDTDLDGVANGIDLDSDNDGIYDAVEAGHGQAHTTGVINGNVGADGIPDALQGAGNADSGTTNYTLADSDTDGTNDFRSLDSDGDGCSDVDEAYGLGNDTDADGIFGTGTPAVNANGAVTAAAYSVPLDGNTNSVPDYTEAGTAVTITAQPMDQVLVLGGTATFTVASDATDIQWQVSTDNGVTFIDLAGENAATLQLTNVTAAMDGNLYRAVLDREGFVCDNATSNSALLQLDTDTDSDGVVDSLDLDDDNDGIPDISEYSTTCTTNLFVDGNWTGSGNVSLSTNGNALFNSGNTTPNGRTEQTVTGLNIGAYYLLTFNVEEAGPGTVDVSVDLYLDDVFVEQYEPTQSVSLIHQSAGNSVKVEFRDSSLGTISRDIRVRALSFCESFDYDMDNDGIINPLDLDSDNDGIYDAVEASHEQAHTNGEVNGNVGNDGIPDAVQGTGNADSGTINYTLTDSDTDGTNDVLSLDSDGDGCTDVDEAYGLGNDTDADGIFGTGAPAVNTNGAVSAASYSVPLDGDTNSIPDYTEAGTAVTITTQPTDQNVAIGNTASFTIASNATAIQWQVSTDNGATFTDIIGENNATLQLNNVTAAMDGNQYRAVLAMDGFVCGSTTSDTATLGTGDDDDLDGIINDLDLDNDNDGIPDTAETAPGTIYFEFYDFRPPNLNSFPTTGELNTGIYSESNLFDVRDIQILSDPGDADHYSIRLTGFIQISTADTYTFYVAADDAGRLFIDNTLVVTKPGGSTTTNGTIALNEGIYPFVYEYYEGTGANTTSIDVSSSTLPRQRLPNDWIYGFTDRDNDGILDYRDLDSDNDGIFDAVEAGHGQAHTNGAVNGSVGTDGIPDAVQGTGNADSGTINYTIVDTDTDGIRNFLSLDSDFDGCPDVTEAGFTDGDGDGILGSATVTVDANGVVTSGSDGYTGSDPLVLDSNLMSLSCDTDVDGINPAVDLDDDNDGILDTEENALCVGQLYYEFYDGAPTGRTVDNIPTSGALSEGNITDFDVVLLQNTVDPGDANRYSIRYTGWLTIGASGSYTFYTTSDDGSKLLINGSEIVDNDGQHGVRERSGSVNLAAGTYPFQVLYFEVAGSTETLSVQYEGPSIARQDIPFSNFISGACDADRDGILNSEDLDSDGDGCTDVDEAYGLGNDTDGDGIYGNGTPVVDASGRVTAAAYTVPLDSDANGIADFLELGPLVVITAQPIDQYVVLGGTATFTAASDASTFQWQESTDNGLTFTDIAGANSATLQITNVNTGVEKNQYRVVLGKAGIPCATITSDVAILRIDTDTDLDGLVDYFDLDDDNDGIPDIAEFSNSGSIFFDFYDGRPTGDDLDNIPTTGALNSDVRASGNLFAIGTIQNQSDPGDADEYSIRFRGFIRIPETDTYTFHTDANDAARLWINGEVVVTEPVGAAPQTGTVTLTEGIHTFELEYIELTGSIRLRVQYSRATVAQQNVPSSWFSAFADLDGDGIMDAFDLDSDNDGIYDAVEAGHDQAQTNGTVDGNVGTDGIPNAVQGTGNADSGTINYTLADSDADGTNDVLALDSDDDRCTDVDEAYGAGNDPDGDGIFGTGTPTVDTTGLVTTAPYTTPLDGNGDGTFDYRQAGTPITIDTTPANQTVLVGDTATFTITSDATDIQWQVSTDNGSTFTDLPGETAATLQITNVATSMDGNAYRAVLSKDDFLCATTAYTSGILTIDTDTDGDGLGDAVDLDDDNDGIGDSEETIGCAGNLFTNADFSAGITGWNPTGNWRILNYEPTAVTFNSGDREPNGTVSQTLVTVPNHAYQLDFFVGHGGRLGSWLALQVEINGVVVGIYRPSRSHQVVFTAMTNNTTITFRDVSTATGATDVFLRSPSVCPLDQDTDTDGAPNRVDLDSDNDGIYDAVEAGHGQTHTTGMVDGTVGIDGIPDAVQGAGNADSGTTNYTLADSDANGTNDVLSLDSDGDGCTDTIEAGFQDGDGDGLLGNGPLAYDGNGTVTGQGGYLSPSDNDTNGVFDFQEANSAPTITTQPVDTAVCLGSDVTFTVEALGANDYQWQWFNGNAWEDLINGGSYSGADTNTLTIVTPTMGENGNQYRVLVLDTHFECGTVLSNEVTLSVTQTPAITIGDASVVEGGDLVFPITLSSTSCLPEDIMMTFTITPVTTQPSDYMVAGLQITLPHGTTTAQLTVPTVADNMNESNETLSVAVVSVDAGTVSDFSDTAIGTILEMFDLDSDDDGILDLDEDLNLDGDDDPTTDPSDFDGDGVPDYLDVDSDNDGILDNIEAQSTSGYILPSLIDGNGNGLDDSYEDGTVLGLLPVDSDNDGVSDYLDTDTDNDGVPDTIEGHDTNHDGIPENNPLNTDSNGDGMDDGYGINDPDQGFMALQMTDRDNDGEFNFRDDDDDGDGIPTTDEDINNDADYANDDSDGDMAPDYLDPDMGEEVEVFNIVTPNNDGYYDELQIRGLEDFPENSITIFNRWGNEVFHTEDYGVRNNVFRGESEGNLTVSQSEGLPTGTYFYILNYSDGTSPAKSLSGYIYLNR